MVFLILDGTLLNLISIHKTMDNQYYLERKRCQILETCGAKPSGKKNSVLYCFHSLSIAHVWEVDIVSSSIICDIINDYIPN